MYTNYPHSAMKELVEDPPGSRLGHGPGQLKCHVTFNNIPRANWGAVPSRYFGDTCTKAYLRGCLKKKLFMSVKCGYKIINTVENGYKVPLIKLIQP